MNTKFTYTETPTYVRFKTGGSVSYGTKPVDATWEYDDGVRIHVRVNPWHKTYWPEYYKARPQHEHVRFTHGRVYVSSDEPFNALEDLTNRRRRPHQVWKPQVREALARIDLEPEAMHWNQKAGCSCGCSPGFVTHGVPGNVDIWVTLPGAPKVDETKPARVFA